MKTNFSLLFYLKKPKHYTSGPVPIYLRFTVEGKRAETSAGREINPARWNSKAGRGSGTKEEIKTLNAYLDTLTGKVQQAHQSLISAGKAVSAESLRNEFSGKTEKQRLLMEVFAEHNAKVKALLGKGFEPNTLKGYNTSIKHLTAYLKKQYKANDMAITELDHPFVTGFEFYLRTEANCSDVSAAKYIKHLRKIVNLCLSNGWIRQSPFVHYKNRAKAKEREYLTQQELDSIAAKNLTIERLAQVRDIFVFSCYTGLAYADVKKLKRTEIAAGVDNSQWIFTQRKKTDTAPRIPLLPAAQQILNTY